MRKPLIGEDNPALDFMSTATAETYTEEIKKPVKGRKSAKDKHTYRINLALTQSLGEKVKKEAWKSHKSVNAYIEDIIIKQLNN